MVREWHPSKSAIKANESVVAEASLTGFLLHIEKEEFHDSVGNSEGHRNDDLKLIDSQSVFCSFIGIKPVQDIQREQNLGNTLKSKLAACSESSESHHINFSHAKEYFIDLIEGVIEFVKLDTSTSQETQEQSDWGHYRADY